MKLRRILFLIFSALLAGFLIVLLIHLGRVNLHVTVQMLGRVSVINFVELVLLNGLLIGISTVRWRSIDAVLRHPSDAVPSGVTAYFVTSTGMALGLILPVQLGMTAARTIGTRAYGRTLKRGTGGTVFEQSFDLLIVVILAGASAITWFLHGGGWMWLACAVPLLALALLVVKPSVRFVQLIARRVPDLTALPKPAWLPRRPYRWLVRILRGLSDIQHSGLLSVRLARRLLALSILRFSVVVLMGAQTARAIAARIPLWHMAAMVPFGTVANLLGITPGGIGVNELTSATVLSMFGTPLSLASQWALANRVLVILSCCAVVAVALGLLKIGKASDRVGTKASG